MENPDLPAPLSAPNGTTPSSSPTPIIITTAAKTRTVYRSLDPKDQRIEQGSATPKGTLIKDLESCPKKE